MGIRGLAEGIILQSLDDLWDEGERSRSIDFFKGDDFNIYTKVAGMNLSEQIRLLNMVTRIVNQDFKGSIAINKGPRRELVSHH